MIELTQRERTILAGFCRHEGMGIFIDKILGDTCQHATQDLLNCDPTLTDKVRVLQMRARDFNEFATLVRQNLQWQVLEGLAQQSSEPQENTNEHSS